MSTLCQPAWIGIGSNLNHPLQQVIDAFTELERLPATQLIRKSRIYRTQALPSKWTQDPYCNAVALIHTGLEPERLMSELFRIENQHGRTRTKEKYQPRTLDLDLLLYNRLTIHRPHLTIPHPQLKQRGFVLIPLCDVSADLLLPDNTKLTKLINNLSDHGILGYFDRQCRYHPGLEKSRQAV